MKTFKFFIVLGVLSLLFSCSREPQQESMEEDLNLTVQTNSRAQIQTDVLLVKYKEGVPETRKKEIRQYYIDLTFLIDWKACDDEDYDTWTISCGEDGKWCSRESDTPVDTDDEVEKTWLHLTCEDI